MYTNRELNQEIEEAVMSAIKAKCPVTCSWIATEINSRHPEPEDEYWLLIGTIGLQTRIRSYLGGLKKAQDRSQTDQLVLPGFCYLQQAYFAEDPSGESAPVLIPLDQMTDEQIERKAEELEKMSAGCAIHVKELRRYLKKRQATQAA